MREELGGLVIGGYEPNTVARWIEGVPWEHGGAPCRLISTASSSSWKALSAACPSWTRRRSSHWCATPALTRPTASQSWAPCRVRGLWMAAGMSLNGFGGAGGIGKLLAEWIVEGEPSLDVYAFNANRFGNYYTNSYYATERTREVCQVLLPPALPQRRKRMGTAEPDQPGVLPHAGERRSFRREIRLGAGKLLPARQTWRMVAKTSASGAGPNRLTSSGCAWSMKPPASV